MEAFLNTKSPLLQEVFVCSPTTFEDRLRRLTQDQEFLATSLQALTVVFQKLPGGMDAKNELLEILVAVGEADGDFDAQERQMVDNLGRLFDGRLEESKAGGGSGCFTVLVVLGMLAALFGVLQLLR